MRSLLVSHLGSFEGVSLQEVDTPEPDQAEVTIRVEATSLKFVDLLTIKGQYQFTPPLPYIPGKGAAGVVTAVGSGVQRVAVGDRVLGMCEYGGFAEFVSVEENSTYTMPGGLSFDQAATMAVAYDTAWIALRERACLEQGETVLVLGASGAVGRAAVQIAKAHGAMTVLAGTSSPEANQELLSVGADALIDTSVPDLRNALREQVYAALDGGAVDVAIDPVGGQVFDAAIRALSWNGRLVIVGFASGVIPSVKANYLMLKNIGLSGLQISDYRRYKKALMKRCFDDLFSLFEQEQIVVPDCVRFDLTNWEQAFESFTSGRARTVVLNP